MTEQIERELTELFRSRAEALDVLPARPHEQVRRGRLWSGMALASVLAVLAGVVLVGARLAGGGGPNPLTTTATGQQALEDLSKALRKTFSGRAIATTNTVEVPSGKLADAPDLGYSAKMDAGSTAETRYDGRTGVAVTTAADAHGDVLFVGDALYRHPDPNLAGFVPASIAWIRYTKDARESLTDWRVHSIGTAIPGLLFLYEMPPEDATEHDGRIELTGPDMGFSHFVMVIQLNRSGTISSVTIRSFQTSANAYSDRVDRVTFRPLNETTQVEAPPAVNVMSSADYEAAEKASSGR